MVDVKYHQVEIYEWFAQHPRIVKEINENHSSKYLHAWMSEMLNSRYDIEIGTKGLGYGIDKKFPTKVGVSRHGEYIFLAHPLVRENIFKKDYRQEYYEDIARGRGILEKVLDEDVDDFSWGMDMWKKTRKDEVPEELIDEIIEELRKEHLQYIEKYTVRYIDYLKEKDHIFVTKKVSGNEE